MLVLAAEALPAHARRDVLLGLALGALDLNAVRRTGVLLFAVLRVSPKPHGESALLSCTLATNPDGPLLVCDTISFIQPSGNDAFLKFEDA